MDPAGTRLWLAAERQNRGLLALQQQTSGWACARAAYCSVSAYQRAPAQMGGERLPVILLTWRFLPANCTGTSAITVCRRNPADGALERCWSFADTALAEARRYPLPYGVAEALAVDAEGAPGSASTTVPPWAVRTMPAVMANGGRSSGASPRRMAAGEPHRRGTPTPGRTAGKAMWIVAWLLGLFLATRFCRGKTPSAIPINGFKGPPWAAVIPRCAWPVMGRAFSRQRPD